MIFKSALLLALSVALAEPVYAVSAFSPERGPAGKASFKEAKAMISRVLLLEKNIVAAEKAIEAKKLLGEDYDTEEFRITEFTKGKKIEEFRMLVFIKHLSLEDLSKIQSRLSQQENQVIDRQMRRLYPRVNQLAGRADFAEKADSEAVERQVE